MSDIFVNKQQWSSISEENKELILQKLREAGTILPDQNIIEDENAPSFDPSKEIEIRMTPMGNFFCEAKCAAAFTAGSAACASLTGPAFAACMLIVASAYDSCKKDC